MNTSKFVNEQLYVSTHQIPLKDFFELAKKYRVKANVNKCTDENGAVCAVFGLEMRKICLTINFFSVHCHPRNLLEYEALIKA